MAEQTIDVLAEVRDQLARIADALELANTYTRDHGTKIDRLLEELRDRMTTLPAPAPPASAPAIHRGQPWDHALCRECYRALTGQIADPPDGVVVFLEPITCCRCGGLSSERIPYVRTARDGFACAFPPPPFQNEG